MEMFGDYEYEKPPQLPYTTEYFLKELPLAPTAPIGQLAGQAASFVPLNPAPLVRGAARGVQKLGTMVGEGMAERVATGRPMLPSLLAEPQAAMFAVEPNVPRMNLLDTPPETMTSLLEVKPQAAVSDLGFYSAAEQAALNLQRNKGSGQAFLNDLLKAENVKKDELQWMGVDDYLKEKPNVTKQEVQDFIANNRVDVQEVTLGSPLTLSEQAEIRALREKDRMSMSERARFDTLSSREDSGISPKYSKYQLPGGENYREILLKLPEAMPNTALEIQQFTKRMEAMREIQNEFANAGNMEKAISFAQKADDLQASIRQLEKMPVTKQTENYQSSHFDEPNILAHIRVNDRVDADGKKMLLIEEIQSDWHQAGREKGYKSKESLEKWYSQNKLDDDPSFADLNSEQRNIIEQNRNAGMGGDNAVPDAPFKDTWYQLALKRALKYAADNGYERVGLTTGKQQADRFNLAESFDAMNYKKNKDGTFALGVKPKGEGIFQNDFGGTSLSNIPEKELPSIVGKELAQKIIAGEGRQAGNTNRYILEGIDLQIGGEGMKKYYDEIYPKFLDKYGKKWNARVGETQIKVGEDVVDQGMMAPGIGLIGETTVKAAPRETIRYIDITPEMKGAVSKGQPLFAAAPALPLGGLLGEPEKKKELSLLD